jgi:hypothetical protein
MTIMSEPTGHPKRRNINFNAQHSPMGAFMSFTCGHFGSRGGIGVEIGAPANQDLYIGVKEGGRYSDQPLKCLPFYRGADETNADAFLVEQSGPAEQNTESLVVPYTAEEIERTYNWATDQWRTEDFTFTVYTPFGEIPDPSKASPTEMRRALMPAVIAEMTVDNTAGVQAKAAFFGMKFNEPGWRPLADIGNRTNGFAMKRRIGVLGKLGDHSTRLDLFCRWTPELGVVDPVAHLLGTCPGLVFEIPAGQKQSLRLVFGAYLEGIVTTGLEGRYLYTRYFTGLEDVLDFAMSRDVAGPSKVSDHRLRESSVSDSQQFLIAHATRSYYGSTQLLDIAGEPFWIVNEGEYCMMNTLDLSVDQMFWELDLNPWLMKNLLDSFVRHYSYIDQVKTADGGLASGGISFTHDMGVHNNFSRPGTSSYELPDLAGCFSYMTQEQLCNWVLMAASYVATTDDLDWLRQNRHVVLACVESMQNRDEPIATGLMTRDSNRCRTGQEITTYDSLDTSLGQSRNNLYLGVKRWAACLGLSFLLRKVGDSAQPIDHAAATSAKAIAGHLNSSGFIPAVFEVNNEGWRSRILAAIEGLIYPLHWQECRHFDSSFAAITASGDHAALLRALKSHTLTLLRDRECRNLFSDGGIKLSSSSNNSWMSKIAIFQHVVRKLFDEKHESDILQLMNRADNAHMNWQIEGSGYWACSDQFVSGEAKGSRYYPRIITAALWLESADSEKKRNHE